MFKKIGLISIVVVLLGAGQIASAHLPRIVQRDKFVIQNPEISQAFYSELNGGAAEYDISSTVAFDLYINILVPEPSNPGGRYSANIYEVKDGQEQLVAFLDAKSVVWQEIWEEYGRDFYFKGPEFERKVEAGDYKIIIFNGDNQGKYVLAVGKTESFTLEELLRVYYVLPLLKMNFFHSSILEFFETPFVLFGAMALVVIFIIIVFIFYLIGKAIKKSKPKSILD